MNSGLPKVEMDIRVPYDKFDEAIATLQSLGKRQYKLITGRDVTAQLASMRAAQKLDPSGVAPKSDYAQLSEDALMPRISLEMSQQGPGAAGSDPSWLAAAWTDTSTLFGNIVRGLVTFALYLLVTAPIWLPGVLLLAWIWKKATRTPTTSS